MYTQNCKYIFLQNTFVHKLVKQLNYNKCTVICTLKGYICNILYHNNVVLLLFKGCSRRLKFTLECR